MNVDAPMRPDVLPPHETMTPRDWHFMWRDLAARRGQYRQDSEYAEGRSKWAPFAFLAADMRLLGKDVPVSSREKQGIQKVAREWASNINVAVAAHRLGIGIEATPEVEETWRRELEKDRNGTDTNGLVRQIVGMRELGVDVQPTFKDISRITGEIARVRISDFSVVRAGLSVLADAKLLGAEIKLTPHEVDLNMEELDKCRRGGNAVNFGFKLADLAILMSPKPRIVDGRLIRS